MGTLLKDKKTYFIHVMFLLIFFLYFFLHMNPVLAQSTIDPPTTTSSFTDLSTKIGKALQAFGGAIGVILILYGAYMYMASTGDPQRTAKAHKIILWTTIGLAVVLIGENWVKIFCSVLGC